MTLLKKLAEMKSVDEWFAVKRAENSRAFQFYEPNARNKKTIEAIAPESGNHLVICLVDRINYDNLISALGVAVEVLEMYCDNKCAVGINPCAAREALCDIEAKLKKESGA